MTVPGETRLSPAALALLAERAALVSPQTPAPAIGPLSFPQLTQWFFAQLHPQSAAFNLPKILTLRGQLRVDALRQSLQSMVDRHDVLRTIYYLKGPEPSQRVAASRPVELSVHDLVATGAAAPPHAADLLLDADAARPFDLSADQLIRAIAVRVEPDAWRLQVTFHHIAFDGWSTGVFLNELAAGYRAACLGRNAELPPLLTQVPDVAAWQRAQVDTPKFAADRRYWHERLHDIPALDLPLDFEPEPLPRHCATRFERQLPADIHEALLAFSRRHQATLFAAAFAGWAALTSRRCGQTRCLLGVALAGRSNAEWEPLFGNFVNVLPFAVDVDAAPTFAALVAQVRHRSAEALAHQHFPFQGLASEIGSARRSAADTLFPVIFNYRNLPLDIPDSLPDLSVTAFEAPARGTVAPLNLNLIPGEDGIRLELDVDPDQIAADTAERWLDAYIALLRAALDDPEGPVAHLPIMGVAERDQLASWNLTDRARNRDETLPALFARQVAATPDHIAVRATHDELSYRELDREAHRIAGNLAARGIGRGAFVAVCMDRCTGLIAALIGVQQAGAAYLPIDPANPQARITGMLEDAGVTVVITGPGTPDGLEDPRWELLPWDRTGVTAASSAIGPPCSASDPAYLMYTSGSTGRPKGTVIAHSAVVNFVQWMHSEYSFDARDTVLQVTSIGFDVSVGEIWGPLLAGARMLMAPPDRHRDLATLVNLMANEQVSVLLVAPTMLRGLLELPAFATTRALRLVGCAAEVLTWDLIAAFRRIHSAMLVNLYGPTEACVYATSWTVDTTYVARSVPIGRPIANAQVHVLDSHGEPASIGTLGELYIAGDGVAVGYLNRPELTVERFLPDPLHPHRDRLMYRTGDHARWRRDGVLEFCGRVDHQVKLRGFRIELGEIEVALGSVAGVRFAAVCLRGDTADTAQLVAYVEPAPSARLEPAAIRTALKRRLPDHMVPATVVVLPALPLTSSGKIDRTALMAMPITRSAQSSPVVGDYADTTLEHALRTIWARLLDVPHVGLDDDFFELGGHSLVAAKMVHELELSTGHRLPIATLFEASTIRTLMPQLLAHAYHSDDAGVREIQRGAAEQPPFFMLTGDFTGGGFYCRALAEAVGPAQPVYAIPPTPPTADRNLARIEGMAAMHLRDVKRIQPAGPYRLGGFCIGGLVAYEMARQLEATGDTVDLVLIVDASARGRFERMTQLVAHAASYFASRDTIGRLDRAAYLTHRIGGLAGLPPVEQFVTIAKYPVRVALRQWNPGLRAAHLAAAAGAGENESLYERTTRHHFRAQQLYRPGRYVGRVDLVRTPAPRRSPAAQFAAWRRVAPQVVLHEVAAGHSDVVFKHLPNLLRQQLTRLQGTQPS